jgi:hydroxymethylpyrimidine pyrophosphatase-like HAD family hydrolase
MGRFFRAVGCDLDGTIAVEGKVSGDVLDALEAVRADGVAALLVTGRIRAELDVDFPAWRPASTRW